MCYRAPFGVTEVLRNRLCDRRGWTLEAWNALPAQEREYWLDWERHRAEQLRTGLDRAVTRSKTDEGKMYPETVMANLMIELVNVL